MDLSARELPFVLCIGGPTGTGKTGLAAALARKLNGEIVNADSRQVFRDFPIITAQPSHAEQAGVPHHLYGFLAADQELCAVGWATEAAALCREICRKGKLPILVGGTGFYFEALLKGLAHIPPIPESVRSELLGEIETKGVAALHRELSLADPLYAGQIHAHDRQRILRGLEVYRSSGKPLSQWHRQARIPLARGLTLILDMPLNRLEPVLLSRICRMLEQGALEEAHAAARQYPQLPKPGFSSIGCREALACANDTLSRQEAISQWLASTRAYAKRQLTWFRGRGRGIMLPEADPEAALEACARECPFLIGGG